MTSIQFVSFLRSKSFDMGVVGPIGDMPRSIVDRLNMFNLRAETAIIGAMSETAPDFGGLAEAMSLETIGLSVFLDASHRRDYIRDHLSSMYMDRHTLMLVCDSIRAETSGVAASLHNMGLMWCTRPSADVVLLNVGT